MNHNSQRAAGRSFVSSGAYRWIVLAVAAFAQTTASITAQGIYTLIPPLQKAFHLTEATAALAVSALNGGQVVTMLMLGWLIDRFGERYVVAFTMVLMGLAAFAGSALSTSFAVLLMFFALIGTSYASVQPGGTRAILRWFPPHERGMATGIRQAGLPLGTALAAMALPLIATVHGWSMALAIQGAISIVGGILFAVLHRDEREMQGTPAAAPPKFATAVRLVAAHSAVWPVMAAGAVMATFQYTFTTHAIPFVTARFHYSTIAAGLLFSVSQWLGIVGRIGLAWVSDKFWPTKRIRSLGFSMAVCIAATVALLAMPAGTTNATLTAIFCILGLFGVGWYPLYLLQLAEMAPKSVMASTISFSMTINMVAISIMPPIFGVIVDRFDYVAAWTVLALIVAAGIAVLWKGAAVAERAYP
jgi:MFS family permease